MVLKHRIEQKKSLQYRTICQSSYILYIYISLQTTEYYNQDYVPTHISITAPVARLKQWYRYRKLCSGSVRSPRELKSVAALSHLSVSHKNLVRLSFKRIIMINLIQYLGNWQYHARNQLSLHCCKIFEQNDRI